MKVMIPGGIVRGRLAMSNKILAKKRMITGGRNSQRRASITQQDPGHLENAMKENRIIPGGWNRHREASNIQQLLAMFKALFMKR